jgi:hypothetical protein
MNPAPSQRLESILLSGEILTNESLTRVYITEHRLETQNSHHFRQY